MIVPAEATRPDQRPPSPDQLLSTTASCGCWGGVSDSLARHGAAVRPNTGARGASNRRIMVSHSPPGGQESPTVLPQKNLWSYKKICGLAKKSVDMVLLVTPEGLWILAYGELTIFSGGAQLTRLLTGIRDVVRYLFGFRRECNVFLSRLYLFFLTTH